MPYNVLGIHPGHNSSAALVSDGKLIYYLEEERLTRIKRDYWPFKTIIDVCSRYKVDELVIGGTKDPNEIFYTSVGEGIYASLVNKYHNSVNTHLVNDKHHLLHASSAFYNSGFDSAAILVIDGAGSFQSDEIEGYEVESIWKAEYPGNFTPLYKSLGSNSGMPVKKGVNEVDSAVSITKAYEAVTDYLGWDALEGGKTMGLSSYGKKNINIPPLFKNGRGDRNIFIPQFPQLAKIDIKNNKIFKRNRKPKTFHHNPEAVLEIEKDLAWQIQNDTQEEVSKLITKALNLSNTNKICIAGGYGLNCVTNYVIKKRFPNIQIYHEPISHDGGTSIGAAKLGYYKNKNNKGLTTIRKQDSIYLGPKYSIESIKTKLKQYKKMFKQYKVTTKDIATLISKRNIVCMFQGRSEAGPRALGNRSILYDPTDPKGKDFVNKVKKREWFRPFAGSVLLEKAHEYFDMAGLEESPFMMYAMDVWPDKKDKIPCITHVDGTCRIQTVTKQQNFHYYNLIQEFEKITGVPILFNTSFNLAGDPLVETIEDGLETLLRSELKYLYLPELEMLLEKKQ